MALTPDERVELLSKLMAQPKRMTGDAGSVINQSLVDLIKFDTYLAGIAAASGSGGGSGSGSPLNGIRVTKLNPPGTV
jgi:hypothetical protein